MVPHLRVTRLLLRIYVPDDIVGQTIDAVSRAFGHLSEPLGLGLVLEGVARKIDAGAVNICFDHDVDAADAIELDLSVFVLPPVAHERHPISVCFVFLVACGFAISGVSGPGLVKRTFGEHYVFIKRCR